MSVTAKDQKEIDTWVETEAKRALGDEGKMMEFISKKPYTFQGKYFINAFFFELSDDDKEKIYSSYFKKFEKIELDQWAANGNDPRDYLQSGCLQSEFASKLLEIIAIEEKKPILSATEFNKVFKEIDSTFDKKLSLIEYLLFKFNKSIPDMMSKSQVNNFAIAEAQGQVDKVQADMNGWQATADKLQDTIDNSPSAVKKNMAIQDMANHVEKKDNFNRELQTARNAVVKAIKATKGKAMAPGANWWLARVLTEISDLQPQSHNKKA